MRRILYYLVGIAVVAWGWHHYRQVQLETLGDAETAADPVAPAAPAAGAEPAVERDTRAPRYRCDGRVYCSQMHSCEEATWFLRNCPGVKMDGEGDGVPCERQWCGRH